VPKLPIMNGVTFEDNAGGFQQEIVSAKRSVWVKLLTGGAALGVAVFTNLPLWFEAVTMLCFAFVVALSFKHVSVLTELADVEKGVKTELIILGLPVMPLTSDDAAVFNMVFRATFKVGKPGERFVTAFVRAAGYYVHFAGESSCAGGHKIGCFHRASASYWGRVAATVTVSQNPA
jgi:hypothetical protein